MWNYFNNKFYLPLCIITLTSLATFLCFYGLGDKSFQFEDETIHSTVTQNIVKTGNYFKPIFENKNYFNKPLFKIWISAFVIKVFGESEFNYRFLDALAGVIMVLLLYHISYKLFSNRAISILSCLFLMSCELFFEGHGVRHAVQDSFMLMFTMIAMQFAISLSHNVILNNKSKNLLLSLLGGIFTALAMLTKGLGGAIIYPIGLGIFIVNIKNFIITKSTVLNIASWVCLCLLICIIYILQFTGDEIEYLYSLLIAEGMHRAIHGYHNINHSWYFWKIIVNKEQTVPVVCLLNGILFSLYNLKINTKEGFAIKATLCWAFVPILFYQLMKSKLYWYIMPSLPGLSMLCAYGIVNLYNYLTQLNGQKTRTMWLLKLATSLWLFILVGFLFHHLFKITSARMEIKKPSQLAAISKYVIANNIAVISNIDSQKNNMEENLYINMMNPEINEIDIVKNKLAKESTPFILITELRNLETLNKIKFPDAYKLLKPYLNRKNWIAIVSYNFINFEMMPFDKVCNKFEIDRSTTNNSIDNNFKLDFKFKNNYFYKTHGGYISFSGKDTELLEYSKIEFNDQEISKSKSNIIKIHSNLFKSINTINLESIKLHDKALPADSIVTVSICPYANF